MAQVCRVVQRRAFIPIDRVGRGRRRTAACTRTCRLRPLVGALAGALLAGQHCTRGGRADAGLLELGRAARRCHHHMGEVADRS